MIKAIFLALATLDLFCGAYLSAIICCSVAAIFTAVETDDEFDDETDDETTEEFERINRKLAGAGKS